MKKNLKLALWSGLAIPVTMVLHNVASALFQTDEPVFMLLFFFAAIVFAYSAVASSAVYFWRSRKKENTDK